MPIHSPLWRSFWVKAILTVALIALADYLFFDEPALMGFGLFALALSTAALIGLPAVRSDHRALVALAIAGLMALLLVERPTVFVWIFFLLAIAVAVLSPRAPGGGDVWSWGQRILAAGVRGLIAPIEDAARLGARRLRLRPGRGGRAVISSLVLPVIGGVVFLALFTAANPLIEEALAAVALPNVHPVRIILWGMAGLAAWAVLRSRGLRRTLALPDGRGDSRFVGFSPASITLSLAVFNGLFALQNGLDLAFLWSGAPLPDGVTLAEYAHRGAYLLIVTAILAGAFVLIALRPGSATAAMPAVRWLVIVFVAQNLLLVASSALRTLDYVEAYGLTRMRISALAWMGLVALGLVLICVRLLRDRTSSWLISTNAMAAAVVLLATSILDLGAIAATWNVRNAQEINGHGPPLDVCYLNQIGPAALAPLVELEGRPLPFAQYETVVSIRRRVMEEMLHDQESWRTWTWRDERRLAAASAMLGSRPPPPAGLVRRLCNGHPADAPIVPPVVSVPAPPLTAPAQPRT